MRSGSLLTLDPRLIFMPRLFHFLAKFALLTVIVLAMNHPPEDPRRFQALFAYLGLLLVFVMDSIRFEPRS